jgi:hypothetical protein
VDSLGALPCLEGEIAVYNGSAWVCANIDGTPSVPEIGLPFTIEISPGPPEIVNPIALGGGGVSFALEDGGIGDDQFIHSTLGTPEWSDLSFSQYVLGEPSRVSPDDVPLLSNQFDTDFCDGVIAIEVGDWVVPPVPATDSNNSTYQVFQPGQPVQGDLVFKINTASTSLGDIKGWVKDVYDGQEARLDIMIKARSGPGFMAGATYTFFDCLPVSYTPPSNPDQSLHSFVTLKVACERTEFSVGARSIGEWIDDLNTGGSFDRTVVVTHDVPMPGSRPNPGDNLTTITTNYHDCFITRYIFPKFDVNNPRPMVDTVVVKVGFSDDVL